MRKLANTVLIIAVQVPSRALVIREYEYMSRDNTDNIRRIPFAWCLRDFTIKCAVTGGSYRTQHTFRLHDRLRANDHMNPLMRKTSRR